MDIKSCTLGQSTYIYTVHENQLQSPSLWMVLVFETVWAEVQKILHRIAHVLLSVFLPLRKVYWLTVYSIISIHI